MTKTTTTPYEDMTVKELKERAKLRKLPNISRLTKAKLVQALYDYDDDREAITEKKAAQEKTKQQKARQQAKKTQTRKKTKETQVVASKDAPVKYHNLRYGKSITKQEITALVNQYWPKVFKVVNVHYDGHYWWGTVVHLKTKKRAERHRMDYLISYLRAPRAFMGEEDVQLIREFA